MKFFIVDPHNTRAEFTDAPDWTTAAREIGLESGRTDHGLISRFAEGGVGMFCYEFGLMIPPHKQRYFAIGRQLVGGPAVFYQFDVAGETVDFVLTAPPILFFPNEYEVEKAIRVGTLNRPQTAINNVVFWRWPERTTDETIIARMKEHGTL